MGSLFFNTSSNSPWNFSDSLYYEKNEKITRALETQAIKRNGKIRKGFGGFGVSVLEFDHNSSGVKVYSVPGGRNTSSHTVVLVDLPFSVSHHMCLYKEGYAARMGKKLGMQDIQIGIDSFDRDIIIKGSDEFFVRRILTYDIQDYILRIVNNHRANITLNRNKLRIVVQKIVYDETTYDDLIDTALKIADQIKKARENIGSI